MEPDDAPSAGPNEVQLRTRAARPPLGSGEMSRVKIDAVGFDLGHTLIGYGDTPLSWSSLYAEALAGMASACGRDLTTDEVKAAAATLQTYNTRTHPRPREATSAEIFTQVLDACGISPAQHQQTAIDAFFAFFQKGAAPYVNAVETLRHLRQAGLKVGVLTDVPYGMPRYLVERDAEALLPYLDALVTSVQAGWRKPEPPGYLLLAERLGSVPARMAFVGDEQKDVTGAGQVGMLSVLIDRKATGSCWGQDATIADLSELVPLLTGV